MTLAAALRLAEGEPLDAFERANLREIRPEAMWLTLVIILVAVAGKWLGAGWGARLGGFARLEAAQLGAGMISRGEVGLIVADVGMNEGLILESSFSAIVVMVLVTTVITPPTLRALFAQAKPTHEQARLDAE